MRTFQNKGELAPFLVQDLSSFSHTDPVYADGRDRTQAEIIDGYDTTREGKIKEQRGMDREGGVDKLDNKRNEIAPEKRKEYGLDE